MRRLPSGIDFICDDDFSHRRKNDRLPPLQPFALVLLLRLSNAGYAACRRQEHLSYMQAERSNKLSGSV